MSIGQFMPVFHQQREKKGKGFPWRYHTVIANDNVFRTNISFANGLFFMGGTTNLTSVSTNSRFQISEDGLNWVNATGFRTKTVPGPVAYGNGYFVCVPYRSGEQVNTNISLRSVNGYSWTQHGRNIVPGAFTDIAFGNGIFVAVATGPTVNDTRTRIITTTDGATWTSRGGNNFGNWDGIAFGNGIFVAVGGKGLSSVSMRPVATSSNGINWSFSMNTPLLANGRWPSIVFVKNKFFAVDGVNKRIVSSIDGQIWDTISPEIPNLDGFNAKLRWGNGVFIITQYNPSTSAFYSYNGINWFETAVLGNGWVNTAFGNGRFVSVAHNGSQKLMWTE